MVKDDLAPLRRGLFVAGAFWCPATSGREALPWQDWRYPRGSRWRGGMALGGAIPIRELMARGHRNDQNILIRAHLAVILDHGICRAEVLVLA